MERTILRHACAVTLVLAAVLGIWSETGLSQNSAADILKALNYRKGSIALADNLATINLKDSFVYLDNADAQKFLTKIWQNPPGAGKDSLGMLLPSRISPLSADGYGVVITYEATGYVSDEDAEKIDYTALLRDMQESVHQDSEQRVASGYESLELIGWARQPYYDKASKKLYWAKRLRFGKETSDTLNYEIRVLGRRGVLSLNVVAGMEAFSEIDQRSPEILSMVSFNQGNLYSEFNPSIDRAAAYGVAGLIAGGILTKAGFFKGLLVLLLASKKLAAALVFGGLAAVWGAIKAIFRRRGQNLTS
jgi:uncharacterized membrane-anchored protein